MFWGGHSGGQATPTWNESYYAIKLQWIYMPSEFYNARCFVVLGGPKKTEKKTGRKQA